MASQSFLKGQPIMRPLCPRQRRRWERWNGRKTRFYPHLHALVTKELHPPPPMLPPAPITPEDGQRPDGQGMQEHTHLARLGGSAAIPLTLFAQGTGTTTADAGRIDHAQTPIGFPAPLVRHKRLPGGTTERSIQLEGKVLPREATLFPGQGHFCRPIPLRGRRRESLLLRRWESRSKLGGAQRIRSKLMAQLQAQVPHPLAHDLPGLLAASGVTTPASPSSCSRSSSARAFSNAPRCRYSATTSAAVNALWGRFVKNSS